MGRYVPYTAEQLSELRQIASFTSQEARTRAVQFLAAKINKPYDTVYSRMCQFVPSSKSSRLNKPKRTFERVIPDMAHLKPLGVRLKRTIEIKFTDLEIDVENKIIKFTY